MNHSTFWLLILGLLLLSTEDFAQSNPPSTDRSRIPVTRPNDPLTRDPTKPTPYDTELARLGSHAEIEAALKAGNEARAATPPRLDEAEKAYLRAAELNPKEARAYLGLGNVYAAQNRPDETITAFQKALELKPKLAEARFNLGMVFAALGKTEAAQEQYDLLLPLNKELAKKLKEFLDKAKPGAAPK